MASAKPRPGKETELANRMRAFRDVLRNKPGLVNTLVMVEEGDSNLVGLSIWSDKEAYDRAMASIQAPISAGNVETSREAPPLMRRFVEV